MNIVQGYISKSVIDFPFLETYKLKDYFDSLLPCMFFGMYRIEDYAALLQHRSIAVIFWCGQDAQDFTEWESIKHLQVHHVTYHRHIYELLKDKVKIHLIYPTDFGTKLEITPLGNKIYAYVPESCPDYHGIDIINQLNVDFEIIIGDGTIPQDEWRAGRCNEFYNPSFIGLMLSPFAGGGSSIIEMGLRGRKCITNVFDLPHTLKWQTVRDIQRIIRRESKKIGTVNTTIAQQVQTFLDKGEFLNINFYQKDL
jgi:hypothetical protein